MSTSGLSGRPTLAGDLRARDDDALAALLADRPDLLAPVPTDLSSLAARATTRPSVQRALDQLDRFTLQVLDVLAVLPEPAADSDVEAALGADPAVAIATLHRQALVFRDERGGLLVPRTVLEVVGTPAGLGPPADQALLAYGPKRLTALAADLGLPGSADPMRLVADIAALLRDPERLAELLGRTAAQAPAASDALERMVWGPPTGRLDDAHRDVDATTAGSPVEWLLAHGLLVATDARTVVLPREVALHLRGGRVHREVLPTEPAPTTTEVDAARVERGAAGAAATVLRQVEDLLDLWATDPPRVLRAGGIGVRDRARTASGLDVDEPTLVLLVEVAHAAGLLAAGDDGEDEAWLPTQDYDDWLDLPPNARWLVLAEAWRDTTRVPGLAGESGPRDRAGKPLAPLGPELDRTLAPLVRAAVLRELAAVPAGSVTTVESVTARLRWRAPRRGGRLQDDLVAWTVREADVLGLTAGGALSGAGRAFAAGDRDAALAALAAALPAPLDHVLLQADLTAVAPGPLEGELARALRLLSDVESTGGATVYRFSAGSVRRAFDAGWTAGDVLELMARHSRTPVPQPLTYLVEDVARRHGRVRVGAASAFVRCDDEATLGELLGDRRFAALRLRRLAPTVLSAQAPPDVVLARLREVGYAPAAESPDGELVVRRPEARRAAGGARRPPARVVTSAPQPQPALLTAAVRALRAGERVARVGDVGTGPGSSLVSRPAADVLAMLTAAAAAGESLLIGYVDAEGRGSRRVVEPLAVEGGQVSAYDHLRGAVRTFAVHRITGITALDEQPAP
jgi:hypothetical protein